MPAAVDIPAIPFPITGAARTPDALLQAVIEQQRVIDRQAEIAKDNTRLIANQKARIAVLEEQLRLERHRRFGASSETNVLQGALALDGEMPLGDGDSDPDAAVDTDATDEASAAKKKKRRGANKGLSPDLPRVERRHLLTDAEREGAIETFFVKVKEELDIIPARVQVIEHWRELRGVFGRGRRARAARRGPPGAPDRQGHRLSEPARLDRGVEVRRRASALRDRDHPRPLRRGDHPNDAGELDDRAASAPRAARWATRAGAARRRLPSGRRDAAEGDEGAGHGADGHEVAVGDARGAAGADGGSLRVR